MQEQSISSNMQHIIGIETKEFVIFPKKAYPAHILIEEMILSLFMICFSTGVAMFFFLKPLLTGETITVTQQGMQKMVSINNLSDVMFPLIVLGIFFIIGIYLLQKAITKLQKKGGCFVGTQTKLLHEIDGEIRITEWEKFTGTIEVKGTDEHGTISMELKTGKTVHNKKGSKWIPDMIYFVHIPNTYTIANICTEKIKKNKLESKKQPVDVKTITGAFLEIIKQNKNAYEKKNKK